VGTCYVYGILTGITRTLDPSIRNYIRRDCETL